MGRARKCSIWRGRKLFVRQTSVFALEDRLFNPRFLLCILVPTPLPLGVHFDTALSGRAHQCLMVELVLLGIGSREVGYNLVKLITFAQITCDQGRLTGPGVCPPQRPTAILS